MARWLAAIGVVALLVGCTTTVTSSAAPGLMITCEGEPTGEQQCREWAERLLSGGAPAGADRLVLLRRPAGSRCAADYYDELGRTLLSAAVACPEQ